jgi:hypothetical protein
MMATRSSGSALLKSRVDHMERRLRELETLTAEARENLARLRHQVDQVAEPLVPSTFEAPPTPRPPVIRRPVVMRPPRVKVVSATIGTGKPTKFTAEVCAMIPRWIEQGLTREQIAVEIGCTLNSLQASCSKRGISLWAKGRTRLQPVEVVYAKEEVSILEHAG